MQFDYPLECLCRKCEKPVDSGLFALVRHGRPLCSVCQVADDQTSHKQKDDFKEFSDAPHDPSV
jgi:hypothetical protein